MAKKNEVAKIECTPSDISKAVQNSYYWLNAKRPKGEEEIAERLNMFFEHVIETGERPTVEKLSLCLGISNTTFRGWENGDMGYLVAEMLKRAKQMIASMDAELVQDYKIPPVIYIFRAKNFYGMKDVVEYTDSKEDKGESESELIKKALELPD